MTSPTGAASVYSTATTLPTTMPQHPPTVMTDAERRAVLPQPIAGMDVERLVQLKELMADDGETVHLARMLSDRLYAYERIACAHASAQEPLRRLALGLFQTCRRSDEARLARF